MSKNPRPAALYQQIVRHYKQRIDGGDLRPGQALPPITKIAEEFRVAGQTAGKAVRMLRDQGYVHTSTQGTFVIDRVRFGVVNAEIAAHPYTAGCRSTVHCANFGFCNRCAPRLTEAADHVLAAMHTMGRETDGKLYERMIALLREEQA